MYACFYLPSSRSRYANRIWHLLTYTVFIIHIISYGTGSRRTAPCRCRQCYARQLRSRPRRLSGRWCVHDDTHLPNCCKLFRHPASAAERPEVVASSCCCVARHQSCADEAWLMQLQLAVSLLVGLPAKLSNRLQSVINTAARLVFCYEGNTCVERPTLAMNRRKDPVQAMCPCVQVSIVWHRPTCPTNFNKSLEWSLDSVWDHRVRQLTSYQLLEGRHWVTERSCRCRQGTEQSAVNSHCCVNPAFIPLSPENSSIHRIFPTILVTLYFELM